MLAQYLTSTSSEQEFLSEFFTEEAAQRARSLKGKRYGLTEATKYQSNRTNLGRGSARFWLVLPLIQPGQPPPFPTRNVFSASSQESRSYDRRSDCDRIKWVSIWYMILNVPYAEAIRLRRPASQSGEL